jgi:nucleotide-binding universal stress UspA family protein
VKPGRASQEAIDFACRLAAERRASIAAVSVVGVPLELPLDAELPDEEAKADEALDAAVAIGELYGVDVVARLLRARSAGRAIVREASGDRPRSSSWAPRGGSASAGSSARPWTTSSSTPRVA